MREDIPLWTRIFLGGAKIARNKSWYIDLADRAKACEYTSYPYTAEKLKQSGVIKELRASLWELLGEIEKQADEIARLKGLLEKNQKELGAKKPRKRYER